MAFRLIKLHLRISQEFRKQGIAERRVQLLQDITGAFRPGILTALMGATGAGKTTLMDVLSGRKTGGAIEGEIRIGGYPKVQDAYSRISGYCEQCDIHSPQLSIEESVAYSAWLRLPAQIDKNTKTVSLFTCYKACSVSMKKGTLRNHLGRNLLRIKGQSEQNMKVFVQ